MFSVMGSGVPGQASGLRLTASGKGDAVQVGRHRACRQFFVARRSYQSEELLREAARWQCSFSFDIFYVQFSSFDRNYNLCQACLVVKYSSTHK